MSLNLFLIVIAGGSGTRFWPKSTSKKPKQLLAFGRNTQSLLAQTISRFDGWVPPSQRIVVTTQTIEQAVASESPTVKVLAEPQGRNTAPCIYWAARHVAERDPNGVMLVMPSDHYVGKPEQFIKTVQEAANWAHETKDLVTLGIQPSRPETGYGYLKTSPLSGDVKRVDAFVEKPNLAKATEFLASKSYLWNGGMFVWKASVILDAFDQWMPEMKKAWDQADGNVERAYPSMTATSIDYGIMEKAKNVVTFPLDCGWDDLGSWTSLDNLADTLGARQDGNVVSSGELIALNSNNNIVDTPNRLTSLLGVDDLIVVEQGNAILVAHKSQAQEIRQVVEAVKKRRPELV